MYNKRALLYRIPLFILCFFGLLYFIVHTPLRQYLPGYLSPNERALLEQYSMRVDSLEEASRLRAQYLEHLVDVLAASDEKALLSFDSLVAQSKDTTTLPSVKDTLIVASEREKAFVKKYEESERFNLDNASQDPAGRHPLFISPLRGEVVVDGKGISPLGVNISVSSETPVMSPLDGTVVAVTLVAGCGYEVVIQHAGDYLTVISGLSMSIVEPRQSVKAGRVVGHAGGNSPSANKMINLQVWYKGTSLDPLSVMNFN